RVRDRFGFDGAAMAGDDGIVVRIPDTDAEPPGAELFVFENDELQQVVTEEVGGSALFAARFRECAARALLLPRYNPGKRSPLWQQRQRASQLLDVARKFPAFPIVLETVREVLQDVYDLPALTKLTADIASRRIRVVEAATEIPSPFARSLLFGYVAAFMYEGDSPLAERRAAALSLDPALLAELLGRAELRELLDPVVIDQTERELQRLVPERHAKDAEGVVDTLRMLGPLSLSELELRVVAESRDVVFPEGAEGQPGATERADEGRTVGKARGGLDTALAGLLDQLTRANRVLKVTIAGTQQWAVVEDAARLRDALGVPLPIGIPAAFIEPVDDPVGDLISRYARTHGPFTVQDAATRFGLGTAVVTDTLRRLAADRRVQDGEFRPGSSGTEWISVEVLRRLRARSLAALRQEVEPVETATLGRFLPVWQHVSDGHSGQSLHGVDGLAQVIDQLAGVALPASAWESLVLPARLPNYSQAWLDELTTSGEVIWSGSGVLPGGDGWVSLHPAETAALTLAEPSTDELSELQREILTTLGTGGGYFFRQLGQAVGSLDDKSLNDALWDLVWAGLVTNDTFSPLRAYLGGPAAPRRAPRARSYRNRSLVIAQGGPPTGGGRWSVLPLADGAPLAGSDAPRSGVAAVRPGSDSTVRAKAMAELLLERHGVVTRGAVVSEGIRGGFALAYKVLSGFEETGRARRGYFVESLGAAQFATTATVDRLRSFVMPPEAEAPHAALTLASTDPANPYGAALPWPREAEELDAKRGHRPGRKAGALVVIVDGALTVYVERGGKTVLTFTADEAALRAAAVSLTKTVRERLGKLRVERIDGEFSVGSPFGRLLAEAGFAPTPQGLRLRA
ncbi:MAG: ATP-dependent helicase, partial [Rhodoglobus sp.]